MTKTLIAVVGPTGIGKTHLAIQLANYFKTEIISADSRQFFREMSIGTAAPTSEELSAAKHHFIHHKSIHEDYNVGSFEKEALELLDKLFKQNDYFIMVGGSGLYIDAVVNGLDDFPDIDESIRKTLNNQLETKGLIHLQEQLKQLDAETYNKIDIQNPHRVIRALEVSLGTGMPYSTFLKRESVNRPFKTLTIGLTANRELIYERINTRVDQMMTEGLLEEVKNLLPYQHLNALNTVGYKELFNYFNGEWTLDFAISEIKKNSRRYAKRQLTWFRKRNDIVWFEYDSNVKEIATYIEQNS